MTAQTDLFDKPRKTFHFCDWHKSPRLKKTLDILSDFREHSTRDLQVITGSMCPGTDISELRANGFKIDCEYRGKTVEGRSVFTYRLIWAAENFNQEVKNG